MHSSGMRTVRSSSRLSRGGLPQCMLRYQPPPPPGAAPRTRHPPGSRPSPPGADPPGPGTPREQTPQTRHPTPLETCCKACWNTTCNACWDITPPPGDLLQGMLEYHLQGKACWDTTHPPVDRHTPVKT